MTVIIEELLKHAQEGAGNPSSTSEIEEIERRFGGPVPDSLKKLWQYRQPLSFPKVDAHVLSPAEIISLIERLYGPSPVITRGFLPVLDDHQSNYVALCMRKPLEPRIVYIPHDDGSRLLYRNFDGLVSGLISAIKKRRLTDIFFNETAGDYPVQGERTPEDHAAARQLLLTDGKLEQFNHAMQLLDERNLSEWAKLIELNGRVRYHALLRMKKMKSLEIRKLLKQDQINLEVFCAEVLAAVIGAGHKASSEELGSLEIGEESWDLEMFYFRRHIPNAIPRILLWIEDQLADRNPHDRPGHFMMD